MKKYTTKTVRISANKYNNYDIQSALDEEMQYICEEIEHLVNVTITPTIGTHNGLRVVDEYWVVYVYWHEEC